MFLYVSEEGLLRRSVQCLVRLSRRNSGTSTRSVEEGEFGDVMCDIFTNSCRLPEGVCCLSNKVRGWDSPLAAIKMLRVFKASGTWYVLGFEALGVRRRQKGYTIKGNIVVGKVKRTLLWFGPRPLWNGTSLVGLDEDKARRKL